jgi:hypothetical protein
MLLMAGRNVYWMNALPDWPDETPLFRHTWILKHQVHFYRSHFLGFWGFCWCLGFCT